MIARASEESAQTSEARLGAFSSLLCFHVIKFIIPYLVECEKCRMHSELK